MSGVHVIGGGLAGSEAAWQLAERGHDVVLHEMRPVRGTAAHKTDRLAELVCSNTFKSTETTNAHGLLKAEMRALGSMVLACADAARVPGGSPSELNPWIEQAGRVVDFLEFAELLCRDALYRDESCGGHFREEHQNEEGEAVRNDEQFAHGAVWGFQGVGVEPLLTKEPLHFENVKLTTRSYK
jgi:succinate dehydrogenase/fumarate reductase flavoprotein subunit